MTTIIQDPERVTSDMAAYDKRGHEARYRIAAGYCAEGDFVVDAACGTGYGADIIGGGTRVNYLGVERDLSVIEVDRDHRGFLEADLETWGGPAEPFDVAIIFETIEHLDDCQALVEWSFRARKFVLISTPIVPTVHANPHHRRDFTREAIEALYAPMYPVAYFEQPAEQSGIWVYGQW